MSTNDSEFIELLASQLSNHLNRSSSSHINLAQKVISFAKSQPNLQAFIQVCKVFGKFQDDFLEKIYSQITERNSPIASKQILIKPEYSDSDALPKLESLKSHQFNIKREHDINDEKNVPLSSLKKVKLDSTEFLSNNNSDIPLKDSKSQQKKPVFRKLKNKASYLQAPEIKQEDTDKISTPLQTKTENFQKVESESSLKTEPKHDTHNGPEINTKNAPRPSSSSLSSTAKERLEAIRRQRSQQSKNSTTNPTPVHKDSSHDYRNDWKRSRGGDSYHRSKSSTPSLSRNLPGDDEYDQESLLALDRDWYTGDEFGHVAGDELHNPFGDGLNLITEEQALEKRVTSRISSIAHQKNHDRNLWEHNRMKTSGINTLNNENDYSEDNFLDNDDKRIHVMVHNLRPPFLEGQQVLSKTNDQISPVRDPQSDMAVFARKGSSLVKEFREKRERQKQAKDSASVAGTILGNVMGVKDNTYNKTQDGDQVTGSDEKFSAHLKESKGVSEFAQKLTLKQQRQYLPAFAVRDELLKVIRDNQVTIVIGETGSGKTTQLTQFLYEEGYGKKGMIGCTQPRRVAAISVAKRVSEEMEVQLGTTVGYSIRFEDFTSKETKIKYLTDGILLRESLRDSALYDYSCIIMDEAHERALNTDVLMGLFKNILLERRDLKLIITSATMNAERFSQFYGGAPQFTIPGRTFPVDVQNHMSPVEDYVDAAVKQVLSIHLKNPPGDILVFMTGQEDIQVTCDSLAQRLELLDKPEPLEILPIYSQLPTDLQAKIFDPAPKGTRKVIVATNIAETSLTVDGIKYVVDTGYSKMKVYNPKIGMDSLQMTPISLANANQRSGRAGRTGNGVAYRLYTERAQLDEMYPQAIPEIQRTNLSNTLLLLKSLGVKNILDFDFMDSPPTDTMTTSLFDLWALGALDNMGNLTSLGAEMAKFPMEPSLAKLLIMSLEYGCTEEMLTIVSMLSVPSVFYRPKERQEEADTAREKFFVAESDHLTLLHVYKQWISNKCSDIWCARHFLHPRALRRAREVRDQLVLIIRDQSKHVIRSCNTDWDVVRKCVCSGYYAQAARVRGLGEYMNLRTNVTMQLHPTSALFGQGYLPEYVVYHELVLTSKEYMSVVTAVDPYWLAELGAVFYSIKEHVFSMSNTTSALSDNSNSHIVSNSSVYNKYHEKIESQLLKDKELYKQQQNNDQEKKKKKTKSAVVSKKKSSFGSRRGF